PRAGVGGLGRFAEHRQLGLARTPLPLLVTFPAPPRLLSQRGAAAPFRLAHGPAYHLDGGTGPERLLVNGLASVVVAAFAGPVRRRGVGAPDVPHLLGIGVLGRSGRPSPGGSADSRGCRRHCGPEPVAATVRGPAPGDRCRRPIGPDPAGAGL